MASNFKGVFIPAHILRNKNLTRTEEYLYCYILNFPDGCFASDKYIAETLGVGERTVSNALSSLRKRGLIYSNGDKRKLFANEITDDGFPKSGNYTSRNREPDFPKSGNYTSRNREPDFPKSGSQTSRNREARLPDLVKTPQGENRGAINNSIKNYKKNSSSNATQTSQASPASSASPTTTAEYIKRSAFCPIASERSERSHAKVPASSYVVEKLVECNRLIGKGDRVGLAKNIYQQLRDGYGWTDDNIISTADNTIKALTEPLGDGSLPIDHWYEFQRDIDEFGDMTGKPDFALLGLFLYGDEFHTARIFADPTR